MSTERAIKAAGVHGERQLSEGREKGKAFLAALGEIDWGQDYVGTVIRLLEKEQDDLMIIAFVGVLKAAREEGRGR